MLDDLFLVNRDLFDAGFDAQVTPRDHHAVGRGNHFIQVIDGFGFFNFCEERGRAARGLDQFLGLNAVLAATHK